MSKPVNWLYAALLFLLFLCVYMAFETASRGFLLLFVLWCGGAAFCVAALADRWRES